MKLHYEVMTACTSECTANHARYTNHFLAGHVSVSLEQLCQREMSRQKPSLQTYHASCRSSRTGARGPHLHQGHCLPYLSSEHLQLMGVFMLFGEHVCFEQLGLAKGHYRYKSAYLVEKEEQVDNGASGEERRVHTVGSYCCLTS